MVHRLIDNQRISVIAINLLTLIRIMVPLYKQTLFNKCKTYLTKVQINLEVKVLISLAKKVVSYSKAMIKIHKC